MTDATDQVFDFVLRENNAGRRPTGEDVRRGTGLSKYYTREALADLAGQRRLLRLGNNYQIRLHHLGGWYD